MKKIKTVAMLLAGGQGSRLGVLTAHEAKPAIPFGGKYRVIDFPLSNCAASGIEVVGVLTQFRPRTLNAYIGSGQPWDLDRINGGVFILPPYQDQGSADFYHGTADAIRRNLAFAAQYEPDEVLILSGDHVYLMDYAEMIAHHRSHHADCTVASIRVPLADASRYGILECDAYDRVTAFVEKPAKPTSDLASMGIYVFRFDLLRKLLDPALAKEREMNDFGKDILPYLLNTGGDLYTYRYDGYFRDIGTPDALYEANMDLLGEEPVLDLYTLRGRICSRTTATPPHFIGPQGRVKNAILTEGCDIGGTVISSVLSAKVKVEKDALVKDAVVMEGCVIGKGATVQNCILDCGVYVEEGAVLGAERESGAALTVVGKGTVIVASAPPIDRNERN